MDFFVWPGAMFFCKGGLGSLALPPLQKYKQRRKTGKIRVSLPKKNALAYMPRRI